MAKSFLPDPLELLRQAVNRLEGRANSLAGRGLEIDQVVKTLHQLSSVSLVLRQAVELALDSFYKRLNLPTGREFAEMKTTLQRLEDKLDSLLAAAAAAGPAPRPARTRQPVAVAPAAKAAVKAAVKAVKARKTAAPARRRAAS